MLPSIGTPLLWVGFTVFVLGMLALDLGVFHRSAHQIGHREALVWSLVWIGLALTFNVGIWHWFGRQHGLEFLTGYLIEKALSVDNIFVFLLIFSYFAVPAEYQHRVLFWGILGALVMRAAFILLGTVLLQRFHWIIFLFGGFLIYAGAQMLRGKEIEIHPEHNPAVRLFQRYIPVTSQYHGAHMLIRQNGRTYATPLLLVLVVVEATDLVFAVDSIPAIFAVTRDPFIVYTSNIFAILGLRSLYFLLAASIRKFRYLKAGLGAVLLFVGVKMLLGEYYPIPIGISLAVIGIILGMSVLVSFLSNETTEPTEENPEQAVPPLPRQEPDSSEHPR